MGSVPGEAHKPPRAHLGRRQPEGQRLELSKPRGGKEAGEVTGARSHGVLWVPRSTWVFSLTEPEPVEEGMGAEE